jgi:transcriptional regulator with XRE-family HTH domain
MDRSQLADFLRSRREALQPEDVGLPRGPRRRTGGLRREEVAILSEVSSDYYARIEQQRGPLPSEQILAAVARGLHLTVDERDHVFRLAGHEVPRRTTRADHLNVGMMRVLDRMEDTPAQVENYLGITLKQTRLAVALLGDQTAYAGLERSRVYRWFTNPAERNLMFDEDQPQYGRTLTALLGAAYAKAGKGSLAGELVRALRAQSEEFEAIWNTHPVVGPYCEPKRLRHPEIGTIELYGQTLLDPDQSQTLMIFTATPGTESYQKLQLLSVIGTPQFEGLHLE